MSEFIIIQVGQCGNQIGSCLLPQILQEYEISTSNNESTKKGKSSRANLQQHMSSFFSLGSKQKVFENVDELLRSKAKFRVLCIDMEDSVVSRFKTGKYRDMYDRKCMITSYPGSGNNWAEGYHRHGPDFEQKILSSVRYLIEQCDSLHGFLLLFSVGGGTGSGLGTYVLKLLADNFPTIERFVACVYPTGTEDVITCSYNMAFATQELVQNATCVFPVENRALLDIVFKQTDRYTANYKHKSMFKPFEDMNSIIVNMLLHLTSGSRFPGNLNVDMNDINTNMIPFPKLNFLASGFSPFMLKNSSSKQLKNEFFVSACSRNNQLIKINPVDPNRTVFGVTLLGRGNYTLEDMRTYVDKLQSKTRFAPWSKKAVKVGLCDVAPSGLTLAMLAVFNTSAMSSLFETVYTQFTKLYQRKAHVHHYTNISGFDLDNFQECHNFLKSIMDLYANTETIRPIYTSKLEDL